MICNTGRIYAKAGMFSNLNRLVFHRNRVYKHYGSAKTKTVLTLLSLLPTYLNEYMTPEERRAHEEFTLKKLYSRGLPVPKVVDSGIDFIVMERICGISLPDIYSSSEFSNPQKLRLIEEVGKLVRRMHSEGVVHGDLAIKQFLLEPGILHEDLEKTLSTGDFKLYVIDFETRPKVGGHYGRSADNILCSFSAACIGNIPYHRIRAAYEKGYGKKIDTSVFNQSAILRLSLLWHTVIMTYRTPAFHRYRDMHRNLRGKKQ
jgi:tRNA A-37 threonylcarbamoyl transferase component Bud32